MIVLDDLLKDISDAIERGEEFSITSSELETEINTNVIRYYRYGATGCGDFEFTFDLYSCKWEKVDNMFPDKVEEGNIPQDIAHEFRDSLKNILINCPDNEYCTESPRRIPCTYQEMHEVYLQETRRLTKCKLHVISAAKMFVWIGETDTQEPYDLLYSLLEDLLVKLGIRPDNLFEK